MPSLRLYHYWRSSSSWRVRWALAEKGLLAATELVGVGLLDGESESPEHVARNPFGFVPVLEFLGDPANPRFLTESIAILEYLEETHPERALLPAEPRRRAHARSLAETINAGTQPLQNLNTQYAHAPDGETGAAEKRREWARYWLDRGLRAYETLVVPTAGRFSVGDELSFADLCLIPQCYNALRIDLDLGAYPTIARIYAEAGRMPGYRESEPARFDPSAQ